MKPTPEASASALGSAKHRLELALKAVTFAKWKDQTDRDRAAVKVALRDAEKAVAALKDATR